VGAVRVFGRGSVAQRPASRHRPVSLALSVLLVLFVSCTAAPAEEAPSDPAEPAPAPSEPEEGVYLYPTRFEASPGDDLAVQIRVKPAGQGVSGCEVVIGYDPPVMESLGVEAGDFLGAAPVIGLEKIDSQSGTIALAMARGGETAVPSPAGTLATATFRVVDSAAAGQYYLRLTWASLSDQDFLDIIGFPTQGAEVWIAS
jgi:hypothetical protein